MTRPVDKYNGLLLVDKPTGLTSHDVVDKVRAVLGQRSVGHTGTLDPAAEGLLVLLLGKATKLARYLSEWDKQYEAEITLGRESNTYDAEGVDWDQPAQAVPPLDESKIEAVLAPFRGRIQQRVPAFSAVRVGGRQLYKSARRGEEPVELPVREVELKQLALLSFDATRISIKLSCTKGTYVRSLAHDLGQVLGCGAFLSGLRRLKVGPFAVTEALTIDEIQSLEATGELPNRVVSAENMLDFSAVTVTDAFRRLLSNGQRPAGNDIASVAGDFSRGDTVLVKNGQGTLLAVGQALLASGEIADHQSDPVLKYDRVLA